jgi:hypothetical protein
MPDARATEPRVLAAIDSLADEVGRLRLLADRLADRVLELDAFVSPRAANMLLITGFDDRGVEAALETVDERVRDMHRRVGCRGCVECRR